MKLNPISELVLNFNKMSLGEKIKKAQEIENMVAKFQGRKPRNITTKIPAKILEEIGDERSACACYVRSFPRNLFIFKITNKPYDLIKDIIHEGWHAYIDDYISGKVSLKTFSPFDKSRFVYEEKNMPAIYTEFQKQSIMQLYDSYFVEERMNYRETALYMLKYIISSIQNINDAMKIQESIIYTIDYYLANEMMGKSLEKNLGATYDQLMEKAIQDSSESEVDLSKAGKVVDNINPDLLKFFNELYKLYYECYNLEKNSIVPNKDKLLDEYYYKIQLSIVNFVKSYLAQKVKI